MVNDVMPWRCNGNHSINNCYDMVRPFDAQRLLSNVYKRLLKFRNKRVCKRFSNLYLSVYYVSVCSVSRRHRYGVIVYSKSLSIVYDCNYINSRTTLSMRHVITMTFSQCIRPMRFFHRAANGIFGKVGRLASEEVVVQLLLHKCMPILLYALEVCALDKRSVQSLDFTINRFFMKLFKTSSIVMVRDSQSFFGVDLPISIVLAKRFHKFVDRYGNTSI